ncbi:MAG: hypothetical protein DMF69_19825 [Acidobacteria bacterium]|nr:MAG: hypothetical protein DMF69_19825 [Acidobacteriota bacterium]
MSLIHQSRGRDTNRLTISHSASSWTFREIVTIVFLRKWIVLTLFGAIASLTIALALFLPNQYQSRMRILVKNARADAVISGESTNTQQRGEVTETQINSEIASLTSKDLLEQVVKQSGLDKQAPSSIWSKNVPAVERADLRLEKDLEISPTKKSDIRCCKISRISTWKNISSCTGHQAPRSFFKLRPPISAINSSRLKPTWPVFKSRRISSRSTRRSN